MNSSFIDTSTLPTKHSFPLWMRIGFWICIVIAVAAVLRAVVALASRVVAAAPAGVAAGRSPVDAAAEVAGAEGEAGRAGAVAQEVQVAQVGTAAAPTMDAASTLFGPQKMILLARLKRKEFS